MSCERLVPWYEQQRHLGTKEGAEDEAAALTPAQGPLLLPCTVEFCLLVIVSPPGRRNVLPALGKSPYHLPCPTVIESD